MKDKRPMQRRDFIKASAMMSAAWIADRPLSVHRLPQALASTTMNGSPGSGLHQEAVTLESLAGQFQAPPSTARPFVWWHWMDGNVTKAGITADLEAMQRVGLGGAHIFNVSYQIPPGPIKFGSPEWLEMMRFATEEAHRLHLELAMHNCSGWSSSGGPWITPDHGMQKVVWSETRVKGPVHFKAIIPTAKVEKFPDFYRDIATLACKTPPAERRTLADSKPKISTSGAGLKSDKLEDLTRDFNLRFAAPSDAQPQFIQLEFAEPFSARSMLLDYTAGHGDVRCALQVSDDGKIFKTVSTTVIKIKGTPSIAFPEATGRYYRLLITGTPAPDSTELIIVGFDLLNGYRLPDWPTKAGFALWAGSETFLPAWDEDAPQGTVYPREGVVDVSASLKGNTLEWSVPEGNWTILRFGFAPNGRINTHPEKEGTGLEVDKMSRAALDNHFAGLIKEILHEMGPLVGDSFTTLLIDSYEVGPQNWTPRFNEEFKRLRGYDLTPYLLAFTGRIVDSNEVTERCLWDVRRTIADLYAENYYGYFRELCHQRGLVAAFEAYTGPFSIMDSTDQADLPMGEFWTGGGYRKSNSRNRLLVSSAHLNGKSIVAAESYTSGWGEDRYTQHPYTLKSLGDFQFTEGINRFIFHRYAFQPWLGIAPGMTMGPWGLHLERTQTWWEQSRAWMAYLTRCQYLLQSGTSFADILVFAGEDAQAEARWGTATEPMVPQGYDFTFINTEQLMKAKASERRITSSVGLAFKLIVLPEMNYCRPSIMQKLVELVKAGAVLVGPPPKRSPSLNDYPACDANLKATVADLWGGLDGKTITERPYGQGKVYWGQPLEAILKALQTPKDFSYTTEQDATLVYKHRTTPAADIYFISNQSNNAFDLQGTFRVNGKTPYLWHSDSGAMEPAPIFSQAQEGGTTTLPLHLDPSGSIFVVFADAVHAEHVVAVANRDRPPAPDNTTPVFQLSTETQPWILHAWKPGNYEVQTSAGRVLRANVPSVGEPIVLNENWNVTFPPRLGAPPSVKLERLMDMSRHPVAGVRYFSGTAGYTTDIELRHGALTPTRDFYLDLGEVKNIAEVTVNGKDLGIFWKPPFRVLVTAALRAGTNRIEVRITNVWANRLIGDEQLPDDREWIAIPNRGWRMKAWPDWFVENKPRPSERIAFSTWRFYSKDDPLPESGLIGPVKLHTVEKVSLSQG